ncbi:EAL domain-containing protein (putative c-di-GMP-specific phosphodiesterase class I) [Rhodobacter sp. JA431]|uniref:GGDEF domain-containing phosphodiesterase n=1 Tax=Rhodobacter sp. JA431 TaxID=570013 RepID=UPI000BD8B439|nr:GGDEF domain-containing phosphodiesterase [Rhodobacter sp. JA431]SOC17650.1 EAL domain-containing protein (putative c-di-GMP-specific phosphodiesterase class I) [Rhodobacter sp. JA431]
MKKFGRQVSAKPSKSAKKQRLKHAGPILLRREMVAFLPAAALAGLWFNLEGMTLVGITALIVAWMSRPEVLPEEPDETSDRPVPQRADAVEMLDSTLQEALDSGRGTACLVIGLDDSQALMRQMNRSEFDEFLQAFAERVRGVLRNSDRIALIERERYAVILTPTQRPDLESMIQLSARLQAACDAPFSISARSVNTTCHVGFCLMSRAPEPTGTAILAAAEAAADEAKRNGPGAIRAFTPEIGKSSSTQSALAADIGPALEEGRIVAYFQPQICTDTGAISGMQALPRWLDRDRGVLTEAEIIPAAAAAGMQMRLAEVMMFQCFNALRDWERLPTGPGPVSLPLGMAHVSDPKMFDRLKWEFERFDIDPERTRLVLAQEVTGQLDDEVILRNISRCAKIGCQIELAGFGTGPISVAALRRTGAERIRIHRSFVTNVDRDPEQQRLVAAIVSFAEGLGLQTVADGVSTIGEHAMLAQLGCNHVQGKAISQPLPLEESANWINRHDARLSSLPKPGKRRGA